MLVRTFAFLALLVTGAVSSSAQVTLPIQAEQDKFVFLKENVRFGIGPDLANDEAIRTVKSALNLSDVQVNALKALLTMRAQSTEQIMQSVAESQKKLEDLLSQTNPNATDVGAAFLASRGIEAQLRSAEEKFRTDFRASLSADQRTTLDKLTASSTSINGLQALGVLEGGGMGVHSFNIHVPDAPGFPLGAVTGHAIRIESR